MNEKCPLGFEALTSNDPSTNWDAMSPIPNSPPYPNYIVGPPPYPMIPSTNAFYLAENNDYYSHASIGHNTELFDSRRNSFPAHSPKSDLWQRSCSSPTGFPPQSPLTIPYQPAPTSPNAPFLPQPENQSISPSVNYVPVPPPVNHVPVPPPVNHVPVPPPVNRVTVPPPVNRVTVPPPVNHVPVPPPVNHVRVPPPVNHAPVPPPVNHVPVPPPVNHVPVPPPRNFRRQSNVREDTFPEEDHFNNSTFSSVYPVLPDDIGFSPNKTENSGLNRGLSLPSVGLPPGEKHPVSYHSLRNKNVNEDFLYSKGYSPLPPGSALICKFETPVRIFFLQEEEGHVVSPAVEAHLSTYKIPETISNETAPRGSLTGNVIGSSHLISVGSIWRLGVRKGRDSIVRGIQRELAFCDKGTTPNRVVVIQFVRNLSSGEQQRLDGLLNACAHLVDEPTNVIDKLDSGLCSVYNTVSDSASSLMKNRTGSLHKTTKWIRKGTGQIVRSSGSLISKGLHFISDPLLEKSSYQTTSEEHARLFSSLEMVRTALSLNSITIVPASCRDSSNRSTPPRWNF